MKNKRAVQLSLTLIGLVLALSARGAEPTAFELAKEANRYVGEQAKDKPIQVPDLLATVVRSLGIDPMKQNVVDTGRPIRLVDPKANPIKEILG
jgi:hypothetical protein